ncbi:hypothetical protein DBY21_09265 [Candidatus Gastranaerophilales bacterium]|nr:MAG: hypothetical protein DBY21_09265 [Candidatus Gastranaerophilales bacterium]
MNIIKPSGLKRGNTIGIIAVCGGIEKEASVCVERAVKLFEAEGFNVVVSKDIYEKDRYLAGSDDLRLKNLHEFFENKEIDAIICLRGGYGAIRLVEKLDYEIIRKNPKIFCGFSDVTALNLMFYKRAGIVSYSGPMIMSDFGIENPSEFTIQEFFKAAEGKSYELNGEQEIINGNASGILWGGNLSTIVSLCGLDFIPDEPFIFFAEDVNEPVYKIDKMFRQLLNIEKFRKNIKALCFGEFSGIDNTEWLEILFNEVSQELNIPSAKGFKFTHEKEKATARIGTLAKFDGKKLFIE